MIRKQNEIYGIMHLMNSWQYDVKTKGPLWKLNKICLLIIPNKKYRKHRWLIKLIVIKL